MGVKNFFKSGNITGAGDPRGAKAGKTWRKGRESVRLWLPGAGKKVAFRPALEASKSTVLAGAFHLSVMQGGGEIPLGGAKGLARLSEHQRQTPRFLVSQSS